MQLQAHQVIVSRVERRHEMRHDGDGNEENEGVRDSFHFPNPPTQSLVVRQFYD